MEFEFCISKDARLRAHISQQSNFKYVKTVMDHFDERQRDDFRNSSLGYPAEVLDIQFSVQLIQQLMFRTVRTDKVYELWFSMQGHLMRFGLLEYVLVTNMGVRGAFGGWGTFCSVNRRTTATTSSLVGTEIATASYVQWTVVAPRFNASGGGSYDGRHAAREHFDQEASEGGSGAEQMSRGDEENEWSGSNRDSEDIEDTGESYGDRSSVGEDTCGGDRGASSSPRLLRVPSPE
ncbi:Hypothetical predicted protein [Olea europaea subsp. europaea]|uniref:Uncharacterized protein n=1 Tax=Olea europaea subsp. europaea TaxID=158383 RepID=A0A8S0TYD5_OLEEU|nr:Hypothetical predicted protein [Olea europaea subsp. europaea]